MRLELHLSMNGSAFVGNGASQELLRILHEALAYGWNLETPMRLRDSNGNRVGYALVTANDLPENGVHKL